MRSVALACLLVSGTAVGGPPDPDDHEVSCVEVGVRGTSIRRHVCTQSTQCRHKHREAMRHSQLVVVRGCTPVSPVWCFELAPRGDDDRTFAICQPTRQTCVRERASTIRDVGPLARGAKVRDGECTKRTSVTFVQRSTPRR